MGHRLRELMLMDEGPKRDALAKELGVEISKPNYQNKVPERFRDEPKDKYIRMNPIEREKSEAEITIDHERFCRRHGILYFHTKVKGEIHTSNKKVFFKPSSNKGFFDMILLIQGKIFVGLELKSGKGGKWSIAQQKMHDIVTKAGGYALVSNSVHVTEKYLRDNKLI